MTKPPSFVKPKQNLVPQDKLDKITALVAEARHQEQLSETLKEQLSASNKRLYTILTEELPDVLDEAGVTKIGTAEFDIKLKPHYAANIAVSWPEEQRRKAFDWLEQNGHGDLIKTEVAILYPRGNHADAVAMLDTLNNNGLTAGIKETIPHSTLTAWLREQVEKYNTTPPLDLIGGVVGRVAKIKEVDK